MKDLFKTSNLLLLMQKQCSVDYKPMKARTVPAFFTTHYQEPVTVRTLLAAQQKEKVMNK